MERARTARGREREDRRGWGTNRKIMRYLGGEGEEEQSTYHVQGGLHVGWGLILAHVIHRAEYRTRGKYCFHETSIGMLQNL
jgi:hypothetical protein